MNSLCINCDNIILHNLYNKNIKIIFLFIRVMGKKFILNIKENKNEPEKFADHIGTIPLVMILPGDIQIIHESSEERRRLFDTILSSCDKQFLFALMSYNRQLEQRNKLLKDLAEGYSVDMELLMVYNSKLVEFGTIIFNKRNEMVRELYDLFRNHYHEISSGAELAEINYQSDLSEKPFDEILIIQDQVDRLAQRTTKGVHKDDFNFILNGFPVKKFGSQGQQKSFLIALKLAQFDFVKKQSGEIILQVRYINETQGYTSKWQDVPIVEEEQKEPI
jgi:DNA replication and repair protein RecF